MELVGLSGYARTGKDEAAKVLVEDHGFTRVAFADKLRAVLQALNPIIAPSKELYFSRSKVVVNLDEVISVYGWDGYKDTEYGPEIRRLLQRLGTEAGRNLLGDNIWVDSALTGHDSSARIVVTDCRFPNEAQAIKAQGGILVRITRPGVTAVNAHSSEIALDDWPFDYTIENNVDGLDNWRGIVNQWYSIHQELQAIDRAG